jgi:hypothetical protein
MTIAAWLVLSALAGTAMAWVLVQRASRRAAVPVAEMITSTP